LRGQSPRSNLDVSPLGVLANAVPTASSLGVYLHVPFCTKRCYYCAFNTAPLDDQAVMDRYVAALLAEIELARRVEWVSSITVGSVFFGGGTPSLVSADDMRAVLERLRTRFRIESGAEITVECNPESVTREKLAAYRAAGVNRISLGVQALDDAILHRIGRIHDAAGAQRAFDAARAAGFDNDSVDLMYGLPALDLERWRRGIDAVLDWAPEHISAYGLSLDAGSLWGATGVEGLPAEEGVVAQYWALARAAAEHGFEHYEISNYARPGRRSRHNLTYWRRGEYLAFGPGGAGFIGDVRYTNVKPTPRYCAEIESGRLPIDGHERLDARQAGGERLILGLRLSDGVPRDWLAERVAADPALVRRLSEWRLRGLLEDTADRVRLSEAGFLLSDALFADLV
jgi:oxygen-independent coproporphyrinogen-3 oxidase